MRPKNSTLTSQELEIMKIVWRLGTATVRDVYESVRSERKVAYTTIMTMMNIMEQKKYLKRWREARAFVYQATRPQDEMIQSMVGEFVNRVFNGAAEPLLLQLVKDQSISEEKLQKITQMIRESKERE